MSSLLRIINNKQVVPYLFISIPVLLVFGLIGYPLVSALYISMFRYQLFDDNSPFVGLQNYIDLFSDRVFLNAFWNTLRFAIIYLFLSILLGLIVAIIVYYLPVKLQNIMKTVYFLPVVTSMVPLSIAFMWLFRSGMDAPINYYLSFLNIEPIGWLSEPFWAFKTVIGITIWKNMGFTMIIYLAGMLGIPKNYYEAAEIDGAGTWSSIRYITLPLLKNTTVFLMVTGFISAFQVFTQVFVLTGGAGPEGSTSTLGYEIYQRGFNLFDMGSASAMGFVMLLFILIATVIQLKYFGSDNVEEKPRKYKSKVKYNSTGGYSI